MKNNKRIALTLALPLLLSISSCKISPTGNGAQRSEYPGDRELNLSLANEDEKSMKEAYAAFFKKTLECDRMHVYVDLGYQGDDFVYSEEDISGTSSHYTSFVETRTGFFDNYKVSKATEVWAFIDGDGNKIYALSMEQYNDRSFVRGEDYYKGGYKFFLWDMNLMGYLEDKDEIYNRTDPRIPGMFDEAVYKTFLSEPKDGISDILMTVTVKDKDGNDVEAASLLATAENGLVTCAKYSSRSFYRQIENNSLVEEGFFGEQNTHTLFFSYPESVDVELPDISDWEDMTDMKDGSK